MNFKQIKTSDTNRVEQSLATNWSAAVASLNFNKTYTCDLGCKSLLIQTATFAYCASMTAFFIIYVTNTICPQDRGNASSFTMENLSLVKCYIQSQCDEYA